MPDLTVRSYDLADRAAVHRIAADTAFFGMVTARLFESRRRRAEQGLEP